MVQAALTSHPPRFVAHSLMSVHANPLPDHPLPHAHVNDPMVLEQTPPLAALSQLCDPTAHSSRSAGLLGEGRSRK